MTQLSCTCGQMEWQVADQAAGTHVVCYCADCKGYATHLDQQERLDAHGGTHIFQTTPEDVQITKGAEHLQALRLGPNGLIRYYAGCCNTPIANTLPKSGLPFVGMVLPPDTKDFGKVKGRVQTKVTGAPVDEFGFAAAGFALLGRALRARLKGRTASPFFDPTGAPVRTPRILSLEERRSASR